MGVKASIKMQSYPKKDTAINEMRYRLERNHTNIQTLLGKLNSYTCEPTDYACFKRLRNLRDDIEHYKEQHSKLYMDFSVKGFGNQENLGKLMREQIAHFKELDKKITAYLVDTTNR